MSPISIVAPVTMQDAAHARGIHLAGWDRAAATYRPAAFLGAGDGELDLDRVGYIAPIPISLSKPSSNAATSVTEFVQPDAPAGDDTSPGDFLWSYDGDPSVGCGALIRTGEAYAVALAFMSPSRRSGRYRDRDRHDLLRRDRDHRTRR